jgi:hypothetical protein
MESLTGKQHVKQQTNFIVGPVYFYYIRYYVTLLGFESVVKCAEKTQNRALICTVVYSLNCLENNKRLTCSSTLNAETSPDITNKLKRTDE